VNPDRKPLQGVWIPVDLLEKEKVEDIDKSRSEIAEGDHCADAMD